jgi:hypothetical protein
MVLEPEDCTPVPAAEVLAAAVALPRFRDDSIGFPVFSQYQFRLSL